MDFLFICVVVCGSIALVTLVVVRQIKEKRRHEAQLEQRRRSVAQKIKEDEELRAQQEMLLALSKGSAVEYDGRTHFVTSVTVRSTPRGAEHYRFVLSGGHSFTPHWLDIQVRADRPYPIWFVEQKEWHGEEPDFDTREAYVYERAVYRFSAQGSVPYIVTKDGGEPSDSTVRSIICTPVNATYPSADPTSLLFEQLDEKPWILCLRKEISALDITGLVL